MDVDLDIKVVQHAAFIKYLGKTGNTVRQFISYL